MLTPRVDRLEERVDEFNQKLDTITRNIMEALHTMQAMLLAQYQGPQHSDPSRFDPSLAQLQSAPEANAPPNFPAAIPLTPQVPLMRDYSQKQMVVTPTKGSKLTKISSNPHMKLTPPESAPMQPLLSCPKRNLDQEFARTTELHA
jgi:hypothetical protein